MLSVLLAIGLVTSAAEPMPFGDWDIYRISDTTAHAIARQYEGPSLTGSERNFQVRRTEDRVVVYIPWNGPRGSFGAAVTIDSTGRVAQVIFDENDGKVAKYRRRRVTEIEDSVFLAQFVGRRLDEIPGPHDISTPAGSAGQHRWEFGRIARAIVIEGLVVARDLQSPK